MSAPDQEELLPYTNSWRSVYERAGAELGYEVKWWGSHGLAVYKDGVLIGKGVPAPKFLMSDFIKNLEWEKSMKSKPPSVLRKRFKTKRFVQRSLARRLQ